MVEQIQLLILKGALGLLSALVCLGLIAALFRPISAAFSRLRRAVGVFGLVVLATVLLGYNATAPGDDGGAPAAIVRAWVSARRTSGDISAWMDANKAAHAWNACAIEKGVRYVYFSRIIKGFYKRKEVLKGDWR